MPSGRPRRAAGIRQGAPAPERLLLKLGRSLLAIERILPLDVVTKCVLRSPATSRARSRASGSKPGEYPLELTEDAVFEESGELPEASTRNPVQRSQEILRLH